MARWEIAAPSLLLCRGGIAWQQSRPQNPLPAAQSKLQTGDYHEAVRILAAAIRANAQASAPVYLLLADCYLRIQDMENAQATLTERPARSSRFAGFRTALGELLFHAKVDSSQAGMHLARAAKALPRDPEASHYFAQWAYLNARDRICAQQEREALSLPGLNGALANVHPAGHVRKPAGRGRRSENRL
jgi:thioredoxin-like negative regulator of GroEL